jgi:hypothetical protein
MNYVNEYPYTCRIHGPLTDANTDMKLTRHMKTDGRPILLRICNACKTERKEEREVQRTVVKK